MTFSISSKIPAEMAHLQQNGNHIPASRLKSHGTSVYEISTDNKLYKSRCAGFTLFYVKPKFFNLKL